MSLLTTDVSVTNFRIENIEPDVDRIVGIIRQQRERGISDEEIMKIMDNENLTFRGCANIDEILYPNDYQHAGYWRAAFKFPNIGDVVHVPIDPAEGAYGILTVTRCYFFTFDGELERVFVLHVYD